MDQRITGTIGVDLGDRYSACCASDLETDEEVESGRMRTTRGARAVLRAPHLAPRPRGSPDRPLPRSVVGSSGFVAGILTAMTRGALLAVFTFGFVTGTGCGADFFYFATDHISGAGTTTVIVAWSDSPVDRADAVRIALDRLELVGPEGTEVLANGRRTFDLLALQNGITAQLARATVPAGSYMGLRFVFAPDGGGVHTIEVDGVPYDLEFARVGGHVVDVAYPLVLVEDGETSVHVDFNVRMSVVDAGSTWILDPRLDAVDPAFAGALLGQVVTGEGQALAGATVSAQRFGDEVRSTRSAADGTFLLGPLSPGPYALVVTAPDHAVGYVPDATVYSGVESGGYSVTLEAALSGTLAGSAPIGGVGRTVRVLGAEGLLAFGGVNPSTGTFELPQLPPGSYTVELWDEFGVVEMQTGVWVDPARTTVVVF